jgi:hypothetical protein
VAKGPTVSVLWLPDETTVAELAGMGLSPGIMSAGLGKVPAEQTDLDITQGNRVFDSLYDSDLPQLNQDCAAWFEAVTQRAESAPADIVPGLLSQRLEEAGVGIRAGGEASCAFSAPTSAAPAGRASSKKVSDAPRPDPGDPTFEVKDAGPGDISPLVADLGPSDLLVAIARPSGESDDPLPIGIAAHGFDGNLTSDSTRMDGYVLSTDVAPTVLEWFGLGVPSEISGQAIRSEGKVDVGEIESLAGRMGAISHRRGPVIGWTLLAWLGLLGLAAVASRGRLARSGVRLVGLAVVYLPLTLLLGATLEPSQDAELAMVAAGAPLLAAVTLAALRGYRALAFAAAATVVAYAADVMVGSPLTALSLLGPNPGLGVRFYGIGNELEAILSVLTVGGVGAALAGFAPGAGRTRGAVAFVLIGLLCAFVFALGRFGADVGAAIVFPVGAAVAAVVELGRGRRSALWLVIVAPLAVLALLALIDLASGANAHLTRSVLDAGGLGDLSNVAQRRLRLSAHSFGRPVLLVFLPVVLALAAVAVVCRDRIRGWLRGSRAMRAGLAGALAATVVGALANDSGALVLEVGTAYLLVFAGFAWAESGDAFSSAETHGSAAGR